MIRVVLDTNILISALLNPQGPPAQAFLMALAESDIELCLSAEIFAEYEEVVRRPKFHRSDTEIDNTLHAVRMKAPWVKSDARVSVSPDPADNVFLECAEAAAAHYLVTGNLKHFPFEWAGTRILSPRQFLDDVA